MVRAESAVLQRTKPAHRVYIRTLRSLIRLLHERSVSTPYSRCTAFPYLSPVGDIDAESQLPLGLTTQAWHFSRSSFFTRSVMRQFRAHSSEHRKLRPCVFWSLRRTGQETPPRGHALHPAARLTARPQDLLRHAHTAYSTIHLERH
jgi:hypothetical protein